MYRRLSKDRLYLRKLINSKGLPTRQHDITISHGYLSRWRPHDRRRGRYLHLAWYWLQFRFLCCYIDRLVQGHRLQTKHYQSMSYKEHLIARMEQCQYRYSPDNSIAFASLPWLILIKLQEYEGILWPQLFARAVRSIKAGWRIILSALISLEWPHDLHCLWYHSPYWKLYIDTSHPREQAACVYVVAMHLLRHPN